jgi:hypothetical protein
MRLLALLALLLATQLAVAAAQDPGWPRELTRAGARPAITAATFKPLIPDRTQKMLFAARLEAGRATRPGGKL